MNQLIESISCCPECLKILPAIKSVEGNNVFLTRTCPDHGEFKVLISKDVKRFLDKTFTSVGKEVYEHQTEVREGCPQDCGWCPDHKQHICTGLIEITDKCNLECPVCYFGTSGKNDISINEFKSRLNTLLRTEGGKLDVLQISGGEPTLHPEFSQILIRALEEKIERVVINTNGLSILTSDFVFDIIEKNKDRTEIYLQFDGFNSDANTFLRGKNLLQKKKEVIHKLDNAGIKMCLAVTLIPENLSEIKAIMDLAIATENITGITFQRFTKTGQGFNLSQNSLTQEDILQEIDNTDYLKYKDIVPLPCSHENCTSISFLFVENGKAYSLAKYIDFTKHQDVLKNRLSFNTESLEYLKEQLDCSSKGCCSWITNSIPIVQKLKEFTTGSGSNYQKMKMLRIVVKNFMDSSTFDVERAKKCCVGVSIGNNKIIPFCINNIFQHRKSSNAS